MRKKYFLKIPNKNAVMSLLVDTMEKVITTLLQKSIVNCNAPFLLI